MGRARSARAAAFTREAGAAILLMRDQYPELERLRQGPPRASSRAAVSWSWAGGTTASAWGWTAWTSTSAGALDLGGGLGDFGGGGGGDGGGGGGGQ